MFSKTIIVDVSCLLSQNFTTGIQRVVIELTKKIIANNIPIILVTLSKNFRKFLKVDSKSFVDNCYSNNRYKDINISNTEIDIDSLNSDFVWLDIDSVWADYPCFPRWILYKKLKKNKVCIASLIYDLIPITNPEYFGSDYLKSFLLYFASYIKYSDLILTNSNFIKDEVNVVLDKCKISKKIFVVPLGSNLRKKYNIKNVSKLVKKVSSSKFLLMVSTLEPRKNHKTLLEAYNMLSDKYNLSLILAGRIGWSIDNLIKSIKSNKLYNHRIFLLNDLNNDEIIFLYSKAFFSVLPSFIEGYGLPIVESLFYGCPVIASDIPVFKEVSNSLAVLFDNKNPKRLAQLIEYYLTNNAKYTSLKNKLNAFKPISWDDSFEYLLKALDFFVQK